MTDSKIIEVIERYRSKLTADVVELQPPHGTAALEHVVKMLPKMLRLLAEGRREKLMRWLGFVQGVLYVTQIYTLEELKEHNKPDGDDSLQS